MRATTSAARQFHELHKSGTLLLPNAWDAGSARLIEECGAAAIATTSAGLAWSCGYPDGNILPARALAAAVEAIARVISVPLTVDAEAGYSTEALEVGARISAVIDAGAVGVNLEDGATPPSLLCAKIEAAKSAAARAGIDLFVNARTDVYLRELAPPERLVAEVIGRARQYRAAGADGIFVPGLADAGAIAEIVPAISAPLNLMLVPGLPPVAELARLGVRRVSAGSGVAQTAYGAARRSVQQFLREGRYEATFDVAANYSELNRLFKSDGD
jgi:2-methylisocitrate lyase-like PEP mutase family enzyme